MMIAAGLNAKSVSTYLGHASIGITLDLYSHLLPGSELHAAAAMDAYLGDSLVPHNRHAGVKVSMMSDPDQNAPDLVDAFVLGDDAIREIQDLALQGSGWDLPPLVDVDLDTLDPTAANIAVLLDPVKAVVGLETVDGVTHDRVMRIPAALIPALITRSSPVKQVLEMETAVGVDGPIFALAG